METVLVVLVGLLLAAVAVAFHMDWLGLWASEEEMRAQINRSKKARQESGSGIGSRDGVNAAIGAPAFGAMGVASGSDRGNVAGDGQAPLSAKIPSEV